MKINACKVLYVFGCGGPAREKNCKHFEPSPDGCISCSPYNECKNSEAIAEAIAKHDKKIRSRKT